MHRRPSKADCQWYCWRCRTLLRDFVSGLQPLRGPPSGPAESLGLPDAEATGGNMMSCYLDEAGGKEDQFTVVCGWLSTAWLWEQFEIDWRLMLASYGLEYFHTS